MAEKSSVLITGASTGIGALYADRFARRGHNPSASCQERTVIEEWTKMHSSSLNTQMCLWHSTHPIS